MRVEGLSKTFRHARRRSGSRRDVHAVRDVSLAVEQAECLGIAGESGSGKSTLARMLVGLEPPSAGSIWVKGERLPERPKSSDRRLHARRIQMVFQDPYSSLDPRQSVGRVLDEVQRVHFDRDRPSRAARSAKLLDAVGLNAEYASAVPRSLSGGQRQRLAIARVLAAEPSVIVLDEAVSALDVSIQAQILNLLSDLRTEFSLTYIFISHDLAVIRQVSDRVMVLYRGRLMEQAGAEEIFDSPHHPYSQLLLDSAPRARMSLQQRPERGFLADDGCLFRGRCIHAYARCQTEPPLLPVSPSAQARCWLAEEDPVTGQPKEKP
ncbi:oligopeptide/dipeptide ABC transporter ATP-binding protein [Candidatus Aeolococcus gillhamiae]|uniref:ABC transporter ATP-binding protein n=1 Tax=Candidatus Aeolococcus gillhamiae TaxID=3127015 RepID=UPI003076AE2E